MVNIHWFFDSVPKDLGITENGIEKSKEEYYVVGGIAGDLDSIIRAYTDLKLKKSSNRKFVRNPENLILANRVLNNLIDARKISVLGTVFYHSQIPDVIRQNPQKYVASDNSSEVGINGLKGRTFAQTIWIMMEPLKKRPDLNPIVCLDNEDPAIQKSVKYHFKNQLAEAKPKAEIKVQSRDRARQNEPKGYIVSDIICSIIGEYIISPDEYQIVNDLIRKTIKFDSKLKVESFDGTILKVKHETRHVSQWSCLF